MGKAGFKSGEVYADKVKAKDRYVLNREWIPAWAMYQTPVDTGTAVGVNYQMGISGAYTNKIAFKNMTTANPARSGVYSLVVPAGLDTAVAVNQTVYWNTNGSQETGHVVWDIDYVPVRPYVSGTELVSGVYYSASGATVSNVTTTVGYSGIIDTTYGATVPQSYKHMPMYTATLTIPKTKVRGGDFIHCVLYRDIAESIDNVAKDIRLIGVLVEYVES